MQHLNSEKSSSRKGPKVMGKGNGRGIKKNWIILFLPTGSLCERWVLKSTQRWNGPGLNQPPSFSHDISLAYAIARIKLLRKAA